MGRPKSVQTRMKDKILRERGLTPTKKPTKHKRYEHLPITEREYLKTPMMKMLEMKHGKHIEDMLLVGSESKVSNRLNIDKSTVSRWISKLNLRWSETNLPDCDVCKDPRYECLLGICWRLVDAGLYDLVRLKEGEMQPTQGGE